MRAHVVVVVVAIALVAMLAVPAAVFAQQLNALKITKTATPNHLIGAGLVKYTYSMTATEFPIANIGVVDNKLGKITGFAGDTNSNTRLDVGETWVASQTVLISKTTTNTVVATGTAVFIGTAEILSEPVTATAMATVTVTPVTGALPETSTPWYNVLLLGSVLAAFGVTGYLVSRKRAYAR